MAQLSVYVLGSFQVLLGGEIVTKTFRTAKERALLVYLAIEGDRPHSREALAELLWPDRPEGVARTNLRQALAGVRRTIGDRDSPNPHLLVSDESVQTNPESDFWLDVHTFEHHIQATLTHSHKSVEVCPVCAQHFEEAIGLYRGDLLAELHLTGCQRFQEWVVFQREQYRRQMLMALGSLSCYDQGRGYLDSALKYARLHVKLAPLEEAAHRQVMQLLVQSGLRSAALEQYLTCRRILAQELGVEPAIETNALFERIRRGTSQLPHIPANPAPQNHLPQPLTTFVNRQAELSWLEECLPLPTPRLLTIVGMAGIGKTRLALEAANANTSSFPDCIHYVDLEAANTPDQIIAQIASAIELPPSDQTDPKEALLKALAPLRALFVLDNFEHLTEHTHLLLEILQRAPETKLLVTSRQRLNLQSEVVLELQGLDVPQSDTSLGAMDYSAVQLFVDRARYSQPGFEPTPENLPAILRMCLQLDGHPLGIELAAAALRESTFDQLAGALPDDLDILQTSLQDIPEKHRSMRTILEDSWKRLAAEEKEAHRKLAIFEGDFSLEAAQQITAVPLPMLTALVDKSMLRGCVADGFTLHPLIRIHAKDKLNADQALFKRLKSKHSHYYLQLIQQIQINAPGNGHGRHQDLLQEIDASIENIRSALFSAAEKGEANFDDLTLENLGFTLQAPAGSSNNSAEPANQPSSGSSLVDPLTGLVNESLFYHRLGYSLSLAKREVRHFAMLMLDLGDFDQGSGHALLQQIAARLQDCLRESDMLARLEADQFGIILENLQTPESATLVAEKIIKKLAVPYDLAGDEVWVTPSIGISCYPESGGDTDSLVQNAIRALNSVKSNGRNGYQLFRKAQTAELNQ
jgi:diguanylate cyclase (GGDEF)-like protein